MRRIVALALALTFSLHTASAFALAAGAAAQGTATVAGTARNSSGHPIENCTAQLRNVETGQLAASKKCDRAGAFVFTNLDPGNYVVEIVDAQGDVIGASAVSSVAAGATVAVSVMAATAVAATSGGISTALILASLAAAAGVAAIVVVANRGQASPSQ
jgi:hypothetical protein